MQIKVKRYNPAVDAEPYYASYDVPHKNERMTALEALVYIKENFEPVAFDYACGGRACGRCAMMCDGTPILACSYVIDDSDHTLEPLPLYPVVKDLVVDKSREHREMSHIYDRQRTLPITPAERDSYDMTVQSFVFNMEWCSRCLCCTSACPVHAVDPSYVGPAKMLAIAYRHLDPNDQGKRIEEAVAGGLWSCMMCGKCDEICNALEIDHLGIWQRLRDDATAAGLTKEAVEAVEEARKVYPES